MVSLGFWGFRVQGYGGFSLGFAGLGGPRVQGYGDFRALGFRIQGYGGFSLGFWAWGSGLWWLQFMVLGV